MLKRAAIIAFFLDVEFVNGVNQQALYFCHLGPRTCNEPAAPGGPGACRLSLKAILCCNILAGESNRSATEKA